ncbi:hypothetical protein KM043_007094 [Ampulex compressa]|nr:hypothetical protein KM043_007094 [Ampulex compressa]
MRRSMIATPRIRLLGSDRGFDRPAIALVYRKRASSVKLKDSIQILGVDTFSDARTSELAETLGVLMCRLRPECRTPSVCGS